MAIKILQAITSVRVGDGASVSAMDLPLARERHTRWPFVPGSALKGALRARIWGHEHEVAVFGSRPPTRDAVDEPLSMGTLRIQQATLLALPVRSLQGTFGLVTCPTALARFGRASGAELSLPEPAIEDALLAPRSADRLGARNRGAVGASFAGVVWLEDLDLVGVLSEDVAAWAKHVAHWTGDEAPLEHLVVVHDDVFGHATRAWTEHRTRNAIGDDGVVEAKKLFTVEMLSAETLWWLEVDGEHQGLLPSDGESFAIGGHRLVGLGRVAWYGRPS